MMGKSVPVRLAVISPITGTRNLRVLVEEKVNQINMNLEN